MRKWIRKIPKGRRFAAALALTVLLLTGFWLLQGRPCFTAAAAYRQGLRNAAISSSFSPEISLPIIDDFPKEYLAGTDGVTTVGLQVQKQESSLLPFLHVWKPLQSVVSRSVTDGICCLPATLSHSSFLSIDRSQSSDPEICQHYFSDFKVAELRENMDHVLIKASGDRVELSLVLEDGVVEGEDSPRVGGIYALEGEALENGWYRFRFRSCYLPSLTDDGLNWNEYEVLRTSLPEWTPSLEAAWAYYEWIRVYLTDCLEIKDTQPAHFELTIYNELGVITKTVILEP